MYNSLTIGRKTFTWVVVVATIAWAMSAVFIALPLTAKAATLTAGDLIVGTAKSTSGPGRPVYYYGSDAKKYLFPSSNTYKTWYGSSFTAVKELTQAEVDAIPTGDKNTTAKPGSCVQFVNDSALYVVDGATRRTADATVCPSTAVYSVPEGFRANYAAGTAWSGSTATLAAAANLGTVLGTAATVTTPAATGALTIALASDNPAGAVIPGGATSVVTLKFNVTAGAAAQTVTGATVKTVGVGAVADFSAVYLYDGATRLTSGRTLGTQTRSTEFSSLSVAVPANSTKTLSVVVDIPTTATPGDTHAFQVAALGTTATVSGLPITGSTHSVGSQDVSTIQIQNGSTPANPTIGEKGVAISEFRLTSGINDAELRRATITVGGTVSISDLANFALYQGSTKLADGAVVSDRVTFDLSSAPFTIAQGLNRNLTVKADVGGRSARTIITYVDNVYPTDLLVVDKLYGYGAAINWGADTTCDATEYCSSANGMTVTTQGGKATVALNGPSASDIAVGSQDVQFLKFSMTAAEQAVEIRQLGISLDSTNAAGEMSDDDSGTQVNFFSDIKVKDSDTGAVLMGPWEITAAGDVIAAQTHTYTDTWTLDASKTRNLVITADIRNTTDADLVGYGYQMTLTQFGASSIREVSTGQYLAATDIVPNPTAGIVGNTMTVRASALTVKLASTPISSSTVKGASAVQAVGFSFAAGSQSDVKVTQVVLTGSGSDDGTTYAVSTLDDVVISAQLYDGDTAVSAAKSPSTAGVLTFDNMNWNITAGATKKLVVKVNLATTLVGSNTDYAWIGIATAAGVTSQDKDSNTVTATDGDATWSSPVNASTGVLLTVLNSGQLTVDVDGDTPLSNIVVGGTSGVVMTKMKFSPVYESFLIKKMRIANDSSADDTGITAVKISYPKQDGTTEEKSGYMTSGLADFADLNFYAANDRTSVVTVKMDLSSITETGISGDTPTMRLDPGGTTTTGIFEAVGQGSGTTLDEGSDIHGTGQAGTCSDGSGAATCYDDDEVITGNAMTVRKTKPTVSLALEQPLASSTPKTNQEVLRFNVAADSVSGLDIAEIYFKLTTSDQGANDWNTIANLSTKMNLYDRDDLATAVVGTWTLYNSSGTTVAGDAAYAKFVFTTKKAVSAGSYKSFSLFADTSSATRSSATVTGDKIQVEIPSNTTVGSLSVKGITWDETGNGAATGINGASVKNLGSIFGVTIVY